MTGQIFERILCLIDFERDSLAALRLSKRLAERNRATLTLIHVMTPEIVGGVVLEGDKEKARTSLEQIVKPELAGIDYEMLVRWGNPAKEIVNAQLELGVQLCVMPANGCTGVSKFFTRSIAERVARNSSCPVLTVRTNIAQYAQALSRVERNGAQSTSVALNRAAAVSRGRFE